MAEGKWVTVPGSKMPNGEPARRWQMPDGELRKTKPGIGNWDFRDLVNLNDANTWGAGGTKKTKPGAAKAATLEQTQKVADASGRDDQGADLNLGADWTKRVQERLAQAREQKPGDPELIPPPQQEIDTTQNANEPIITRSHNEEYIQKKAQWSDNSDVKAAADKGFEVGKAYREGDPYDLVPEYINAGSKEYMERADMKVWAEANPEAAAALRAKGERREARWAERERTQNAAFNRKDSGSSATDAGGYSSEGPYAGYATADGVNTAFNPANDGEGVGVGKEEGILGKHPEDWARMQAESGFDTANGGMYARSGPESKALAKARDFNGGGGQTDVQEAAIIDALDQNPGMTRGQAVKTIEAGNLPGRRQTNLDRAQPTSRQVSNEMLDEEAELEGLHRNNAIDMVRTDQPMAHLEMGKQYSVPSMNRSTANSPLQRAGLAQAQATGGSGSMGMKAMQPASGLNAASTQKTPLRYEQGNIHTHRDQDIQERSDHISADRFAYEASKQVGQRLFGDDYTPAREKPLF